MKAVCCSNTKQRGFEECHVDQKINKVLRFVNIWDLTCVLAIVFCYTRGFIKFWNKT